MGPDASQDHAFFGSPSSLKRTQNCPGWIAFGRDIPPLPDSEYSTEGVVFHDYIKQVAPLYITKRPLKEIAVATADLPRAKYPDMESWVIATSQKVADMWERFSIKHINCTFHVELKVKLTPDIWGTADLVFIGKNRKTGLIDIVIIDYKYGMGVVVSAEGNLQVTAYILATIATLGLKNIGICMGLIAQMRVDSSWQDNRMVFHAKDMPKHFSTICQIVDKGKTLYVRNDAQEIRSSLHPSDECRFCKCSPVCPALDDELKESTTALVGINLKLPKAEKDKALLTAVRKLTLHEQVAIFKRKSYIEDFLNAVASNLKSAFESGVDHPDLKLVRTAGRRSWDLDKFDEVDIAEAMVDQGFKPWVKTLKALTTLEKEGAEVTKLTRKSSGNVELVRSTDSREGIEIKRPDSF